MRDGFLTIIISIRVQFLVLALVCVWLGVAVARHVGGDLFFWDVLMAFAGGVLAHAAVNLLNDYHDTRSGLDDRTRRTPFSGGSGALQRFPGQEKSVLCAGIGALVLTVLCGVWFVWRGRWGIVPVGLLGMLLIVVYTPFLTRMPLLCLLAPGFAFGPLVVFGTYYAVGGALNSSLIYWVCAVPFFLVNNLLLLNQVPDMQADASVGRDTMPIRYGLRKVIWILAGFYAGAFFIVLWLALTGLVSYWAFCLFVLIIPAVVALRTVGEYRKNMSVRLEPALRNNVLVCLLVPLILGIVLFVKK